MAFLKKIRQFAGNGSVNAQGQDLKTFLAGYDPKKFDCPSNTVDIIVLKYKEAFSPEAPCRLLMIKRKNHPCIGEWALPGGFVDLRENLEDAAKRELEEETGVSDIPIVQMKTWGDYDRDPRWRIITTSYLAVVEGDIPVKAGDDAADALWMDLTLMQVSRRGKNTVYRLFLENRPAEISLHALVRVTVQSKGVLVENGYKILETRGIAMDHGAIILQALLRLRQG